MYKQLIWLQFVLNFVLLQNRLTLFLEFLNDPGIIWVCSKTCQISSFNRVCRSTADLLTHKTTVCSYNSLHCIVWINPLSCHIGPSNKQFNACWISSSGASLETLKILTNSSSFTLALLIRLLSRIHARLVKESAGFLLPGICRISQSYDCKILIHFQMRRLTYGWFGRCLNEEWSVWMMNFTPVRYWRHLPSADMIPNSSRS